MWGDISCSVNGENVLGCVAYKNKLFLFYASENMTTHFEPTSAQPECCIACLRHHAQMASAKMNRGQWNDPLSISFSGKFVLQWTE